MNPILDPRSPGSDALHFSTSTFASLTGDDQGQDPDPSFGALNYDDFSFLKRSQAQSESNSAARYDNGPTPRANRTSYGYSNGQEDDNLRLGKEDDSRLNFDFDAYEDVDPDDTISSYGNRKKDQYGGLLSGMEEKRAAAASRTSTRASERERKKTLTLKEQEQKIDDLQKENFGLKMKIFFLEEQLQKLSPEHLSGVLRENVEVKTQIQTLTHELKKYKKLVLELHKAIEDLQRQNKCDLPHMSDEQQAEYDRALDEAHQYKQEIDALHAKLAEIGAEMGKLRDILKKQSRNYSGTMTDEEREQLLDERDRAFDDAEKYREEMERFKLLAEEQAQQLRGLKNQGISANPGQSDRMKKILSDRDDALRERDDLTQQLAETQDALAREAERAHQFRIERDAARSESEMLAKSILEMSQDGIDLSTRLNKVAQMTERNSEVIMGANELAMDDAGSEEGGTSETTMYKLQRDFRERLEEEVASIRREERERVEDMVDQLEEQVEAYRGQLAEHQALLQEREAETNALFEEVEILRNRESRVSQMLGIDEQDEEEMEEDGQSDIMAWRSDRVEESIAQLRDRNAELTIQLKESLAEIEALRDDMDEMLDAQQRETEDIAESKGKEAHRLREIISELKEELGQFRAENDALAQELEMANRQLRDIELEQEEVLAKVDTDLDEKDRELATLQDSLNRLAEDFAALEDSMEEKIQRISELEGLLDSKVQNTRQIEQEYEDTVNNLEEQIARLQAEYEQLQDIHQAATTDIDYLREEIENYATKIQELQEQHQLEVDRRSVVEREYRDEIAERQKDREQFEREKQRMRREGAEEERKWETVVKELEEKLVESVQQAANNSMSLTERESDVHYLQQQIENQIARSRDLADRYRDQLNEAEMELEQRTQERDNARTDIEKMRKELEESNAQIQEKNEATDKMSLQGKKLFDRVREITEASLKNEEKLQAVQNDLRDKLAIIANLTSKNSDLEFRLTEHGRATSMTENQYREHVTERNTLLMTIYQYLDTILGSLSGQPTKSYPKPSANFPLFSEHVISKLKALSRLNTAFEKRAQELYQRSQDQFSVLEKQVDNQSRRVDKCAHQIKTLKDQGEYGHEQVSKYRNLADKKTKEIEISRRTKIELEAQITTFRERISELTEIEARAKHYENRSKQLQAKYTDADEIWKARLKEMETRTKEAEEKVKRERKGAQEKIIELLEFNKDLEKKADQATKKSEQLTDVLDKYKAQLEAKPEDKAITRPESSMVKLNEQLKAVESEKQKLRLMEEDYNASIDAHKRLQRQLAKRDMAINKVLERLEELTQKKDLMENALLKTATEEIKLALKNLPDIESLTDRPTTPYRGTTPSSPTAFKRRSVETNIVTRKTVTQQYGRQTSSPAILTPLKPSFATGPRTDHPGRPATSFATARPGSSLAKKESEKKKEHRKSTGQIDSEK